MSRLFALAPVSPFQAHGSYGLMSAKCASLKQAGDVAIVVVGWSLTTWGAGCFYAIRSVFDDGVGVGYGCSWWRCFGSLLGQRNRSLKSYLWRPMSATFTCL